jgi:hypothetical protein
MSGLVEWEVKTSVGRRWNILLSTTVCAFLALPIETSFVDLLLRCVGLDVNSGTGSHFLELGLQE